MAIDFPASPTLNQTYVYNGITYKYSAQGVWEVVGGFISTSTVNVQVFATAGSFTYTPISGMRYCTIECIGGGGGAAGSGTGGTGFINIGGGGGSGGYSRKTVNAATIGASKSVTVGAGGTGGTAAGGAGGTGGQTTVAGLCTANGGLGGQLANVAGGAGGDVASAVGDIIAAGSPGQGGGSVATASTATTLGTGGSSVFGGGAVAPVWGASGVSTAGVAGRNYGAGGSGASIFDTGTGKVGGAGAPGVVVITEYL